MARLTEKEKTYISEVVKYFVKQGVEITEVVKADEDNRSRSVLFPKTELFFFSKDGDCFHFLENRLCFNGLDRFTQYNVKELLEEE